MAKPIAQFTVKIADTKTNNTTFDGPGFESMDNAADEIRKAIEDLGFDSVIVLPS